MAGDTAEQAKRKKAAAAKKVAAKKAADKLASVGRKRRKRPDSKGTV